MKTPSPTERDLELLQATVDDLEWAPPDQLQVRRVRGRILEAHQAAATPRTRPPRRALMVGTLVAVAATAAAAGWFGHVETAPSAAPPPLVTVEGDGDDLRMKVRTGDTEFEVHGGIAAPSVHVTRGHVELRPSHDVARVLGPEQRWTPPVAPDVPPVPAVSSTPSVPVVAAPVPASVGTADRAAPSSPAPAVPAVVVRPPEPPPPTGAIARTAPTSEPMSTPVTREVPAPITLAHPVVENVATHDAPVALEHPAVGRHANQLERKRDRVERKQDRAERRRDRAERKEDRKHLRGH